MGGDSNSNNLLDLGETWTFTAVRTVFAGQYIHTSSAIGLDSISQVPIAADLTSYFVPANADFNSDTIVDAGDYVTWRKNSGITSGAVLSQGDANGDGMVDSIDYDFWRAQFSTPIDAGGGTEATAASGTESVAAGQSNQSVSRSPAGSTSTALLQGKDALDANEAVFGSLLLSGEQRSASLRRSVERVRTLAAALPRDWSELLNDLAERKVRRGVVDESAHVSYMRFTESAESTDSSTQIDCSVAKPLVSI